MPKGAAESADKRIVDIGSRAPLCLLLGLLVACGSQYGPGKTPRETIRNFEGALRDLDFGAAYDMMSPAARSKVDQQIRAAQRACAAIPEEMQEQFGLDDFVDATPREALAVAGKKAKKENPGQAEQLRKLSLVVLDVKEYGNTAAVQVSMIFQGREADDRMKLVKVDGRWYFENDSALTATAPIPVAPVMPTPTFT